MHRLEGPENESRFEELLRRREPLFARPRRERHLELCDDRERTCWSALGERRHGAAPAAAVCLAARVVQICSARRAHRREQRVHARARPSQARPHMRQREDTGCPSRPHAVSESHVSVTAPSTRQPEQSAWISKCTSGLSHDSSSSRTPSRRPRRAASNAVCGDSPPTMDGGESARRCNRCYTPCRPRRALGMCRRRTIAIRKSHSTRVGSPRTQPGPCTWRGPRRRSPRPTRRGPRLSRSTNASRRSSHWSRCRTCRTCTPYFSAASMRNRPPGTPSGTRTDCSDFLLLSVRRRNQRHLRRRLRPTTHSSLRRPKRT